MSLSILTAVLMTGFGADIKMLVDSDVFLAEVGVKHARTSGGIVCHGKGEITLRQSLPVSVT